MSSYQLADLPFELQIEIFSNILSIKHLVKVLLINKSTHDQLVQSKIFWNNLINNYSKPFQSSELSASATSKLLSSDELNVHSIKKQFYELIDAKLLTTLELEETNIEFEYVLLELEMASQDMLEEIEYASQKGVAIIDQMKLKVESLQKETESTKSKMKEIEEKLKKMQIDYSPVSNNAESCHF